MAHAQKPDFVFRGNGRVHLNRRGRQFSRLLAAEVCASAVVMLDTSSSVVVWRVLATHSIHQFLLHFPSRASPCAITFQLGSSIFWNPSSKQREQKSRSALCIHTGVCWWSKNDIFNMEYEKISQCHKHTPFRQLWRMSSHKYVTRNVTQTKVRPT